MLAPELRPLPVTTEPLPGESWSSWFSRVAQLNDLTPHRASRATGLPYADDILTEVEVQQASRILRTPASIVDTTQLGRWTGSMFRHQPTSTRSRSGPSWTWIPDTDHCPTCTSAGIRRLEWRLPWILVCSRHGTTLARASQPMPTLSAEAMDLSHGLLGLLSCEERPGFTLERINIWRDSLAIVRAVKSSETNGRADLLSAELRALHLAEASRFALAPTPERRVKRLRDAYVDAGWNQPTRCQLPTPLSHAFRDAFDWLTASWAKHGH